jgi:phosphatidylserine decarboxylase
MTFFDNAGPSVVLFSIQCITLLIIGSIFYIVRRRRSSEAQSVLPIHQETSSTEKIQSSNQIVLAEQVVEWLPPNHFDGSDWVAKIAAQADASKAELHPVLKEFQSTIENDPILFMLFTRMFHEVPESRDPTGRPEVRDFHHMLRAFNVVLSMGPPWAYTSAGQKGAIGAPITAIINWPMGTTAGREAFLNPIVNSQIKNVLNAWGEYLVSPASASVLSEDSNGWLCKQAKKTMAEVATIHTHSKHPAREFEHMFVCDPTKPNLGYKSWDDFFTRRFADHVRPIPEPLKDAPLILSACESAPYRIAHNVQARTKFWVKAQPYSLVDMLADGPYTDRFVNGTVYQAYLSALSYHRWHSPISGTVLKMEHISGTYFAENYRAPSDPYDPVGPIGHVLRQSQGYISEVAARMVMYIQADDERIGLVAALFIGMVEVSSCEATVAEGQHVEAGEECGMFHFGKDPEFAMLRDLSLTSCRWVEPLLGV